MVQGQQEEEEGLEAASLIEYLMRMKLKVDHRLERLRIGLNLTEIFWL